MDHYSQAEINKCEPGEIPAFSTVILSYNMESKSVSTKPRVRGEAAAEFLALLPLRPTMLSLALELQQDQGSSSPVAPGQQQAHPTGVVCTTGRAQHCPIGTGLQGTCSGPWQDCWHGARAGWSECSLVFLPPNCFYLIRPISVPSPAHTRARGQRWFGIVRSAKTASGRGGQTWHCQTAI